MQSSGTTHVYSIRHAPPLSSTYTQRTDNNPPKHSNPLQWIGLLERVPEDCLPPVFEIIAHYCQTNAPNNLEVQQLLSTCEARFCHPHKIILSCLHYQVLQLLRTKSDILGQILSSSSCSSFFMRALLSADAHYRGVQISSTQTHYYYNAKVQQPQPLTPYQTLIDVFFDENLRTFRYEDPRVSSDRSRKSWQVWCLYANFFFHCCLPHQEESKIPKIFPETGVAHRLPGAPSVVDRYCGRGGVVRCGVVVCSIQQDSHGAT